MRNSLPESPSGPPPGTDAHPVILFDGQCVLCDRSVLFIIDRDRVRRYRFAPLQSEAAGPYLRGGGLPEHYLEGIVLVEGGRYFTKSTAILKILRRIDGPYFLLYPLVLVPTVLRNPLYDWFVRRRYKWFGKLERCRVSADLEGRLVNDVMVDRRMA